MSVMTWPQTSHRPHSAQQQQCRLACAKKTKKKITKSPPRFHSSSGAQHINSFAIGLLLRVRAVFVLFLFFFCKASDRLRGKCHTTLSIFFVCFLHVYFPWRSSHTGIIGRTSYDESFTSIFCIPATTRTPATEYGTCMRLRARRPRQQNTRHARVALVRANAW